MKVSVARSFSVRLLLIIPGLLGFIESRKFDVILKLFIAVLIGWTLSYNLPAIRSGTDRFRSNYNTLVWYKNLPPGYFDELEQKSREIHAKHLEALKPRPPEENEHTEFPYVTAKSYVVFDVPSKSVLVSRDAGTAMPPASTAKLATALASLKIYKLDEVVAVPEFCTQLDSTKAEFLPEQRFLVSDLLKALLVYSSGDAGCVLSIGKTSYAEFVSLMNQVAQEAGLKNTKFTNPVGLDDSDGQNFSSAEDLATLGLVAVSNPMIKEVVQMKEFELSDIDGQYSKKLTNTNRFLFEIPGTVGIKTGTTTGAGEVLIYEYSKDGVDLVIVVMGSSDRFGDTRAILDWVLKSYTWI